MQLFYLVKLYTTEWCRRCGSEVITYVW